MTSGSPENAWLVLAAGDARQHGGNDGYDDVVDRYYSWDSTVANSRAVSVGDAIVLWDKKVLLGASVIDAIESAEGTKTTYSCPRCGQAHLKARKTKRPIYKCFKCGHVFDKPTRNFRDITTYRSRHEAGWNNLDSVLDGGELRGLCVNPRSQLSLRPLRWNDFRQTVESRIGKSALRPLYIRSRALAGGHTQVLTRVRIGQAAFRRALLERYGAVCAFSGPTPKEALEAAHLYSYAAETTHHEYGGLLLRRDLHRLFDVGQLLVDPADQRLRVTNALSDFPAYKALDQQPLAVELKGRQLEWINDHWGLHKDSL
jgi:ribosomal protein L37AE/L43A